MGCNSCLHVSHHILSDYITCRRTDIQQFLNMCLLIVVNARFQVAQRIEWICVITRSTHLFFISFLAVCASNKNVMLQWCMVFGAFCIWSRIVLCWYFLLVCDYCHSWYYYFTRYIGSVMVGMVDLKYFWMPYFCHWLGKFISQTWKYFSA
jgi:hypothetical protein